MRPCQGRDRGFDPRRSRRTIQRHHACGWFFVFRRSGAWKQMLAERTSLGISDCSFRVPQNSSSQLSCLSHPNQTLVFDVATRQLRRRGRSQRRLNRRRPTVRRRHCQRHIFMSWVSGIDEGSNFRYSALANIDRPREEREQSGSLIHTKQNSLVRQKHRLEVYRAARYLLTGILAQAL